MGVPPGISFILFFYQIQGFPQFQLPLAMLWKRETTRIWGEKFDRKTFTIICEVICRFSRESRRGQISRLVKQTNSIQARSPFRFDTRVCQWFYNSRSNDQKRLQWAVFYGTSAAWCLYRPDTPHSFLAFKRKDYRNVIRDWGETWGMKFDTKYSCKMSQVTYTVTQSIV